MKRPSIRVVTRETDSLPGRLHGNRTVPELLEELVKWAVEARASDIHLQMREKKAEVMFRLDGVMVGMTTLPESVAERVLGRIKYLARLKTYQESLPQDGRIGKEELKIDQDVRVATYPTVTGEKVVLRFFSEEVHALSELGFPGSVLEELRSFLRKQTGLLLLTGPAGSGKTTTIYACLRHLVELGGRHIITVEDPVEQVVPGLMQTEVNEARGLTFAKAARHLLRQDPQILVMGEIRDEETAMIAVRAALTGHLVISTLHAGSCAGVLQRLLMMCPDSYAVAAAVHLILNQRLMRRLCASCRGAGCDHCLKTGYWGRVPVLEWVLLTEEQRKIVRSGEASGVAPACLLEEAAGALVKSGVTDRAEFERHFGS